MNPQSSVPVSGWSEAAPLHLPLGLWLLPAAPLRLRISLPNNGALHGVSVSGWEATEKVRELARPDTLSALKLVSSGPSRLRFHAELDDRRKLRPLVKKLNGAAVQLSGFKDPLKLEAFEPESEFPVRHTWDSFFRDAPNMDEMKPGERPDTLHLSNLPVRWFKDRRSTDDDPKPSENLFRKVFERFGKIRCVDVPVCDPFRKQMKEHMTGMSKFSFDSEVYFEGYVQFSEYDAFKRAMDALRDMKLARKDEDGSGSAVSIRVDFDKSKHLTDASVKRRSIVRERLMARQKARELKEEEEVLTKKKQEEAERREKDRSEKEKLTHMQEREQRRKDKQLAKLKEKESSEINSKIAHEKKKLLRTQRKIQSIKLIEELFRRIQFKHKNNPYKKEGLYQSASSSFNSRRENNKKELKKIEKALLLENKEKSARDKLVSKYMSAQEQELEEQRQKLQKALDGKIVLRSVLDTGKRKLRASSISSLSSGSDIPEYSENNIKLEKNTSPERKTFHNKPEGNDVIPADYAGPPQHYNYGGYGPYGPQNYGYQQTPNHFYPRFGYFPPQDPNFIGRGRGYVPRRSRGAPYGRGYRNSPRMPYFDGPDANQAYYKYFKKLTAGSSGDHDRNRSYSRSRSRSRRRSYSRSRSRSSRSRSRSRRRTPSRYRSKYSRSRSYSSRSRSKSRRSRSRSRSRSSRSKHSRRTKSRSYNRSRSKSRDRKAKSKSKSPTNKVRSKSRSQSKSKENNQSKPKTPESSATPTNFIPRSVMDNMSKSKKTNEQSTPDFEKESAVVASPTEHSKSWSPHVD